MRLRHIEIFQAIRQTGSISGAAQLLHVSQPAVTKVLQHAEQQLGFPLFLRVKGKLQATPEALELEHEVDKVSESLQGCGAWPRACAASRATACGSAPRRHWLCPCCRRPSTSGPGATRTSSASCPAPTAANWCRTC